MHFKIPASVILALPLTEEKHYCMRDCIQFSKREKDSIPPIENPPEKHPTTFCKNYKLLEKPD